MRNEELFKERPVWNAILTLAIPSVLSILVMLLYNMADMFFVGLLHDHVQVAAVSVVGPIFSLVTAAATMVGVGGCAAIAKAAGAGEVDHAKTCASLCGWFCILFGTAAALILLGYANSLLPVLGATPEMMKHSATYLRVLAIGTPFMLFGTGFAPLLRADGAVKIGFLGNLAGTILNLLLDPVLILGFSMGVTGAAAATVLGNMLSSSIYLWYVFRRSGILTLHPHFALREPQALLQIFALGLPNAVSDVLSGFASTFSNRLLNPYGTEALAAMGAAGKVQCIVWRASFHLRRQTAEIFVACAACDDLFCIDHSVEIRCECEHLRHVDSVIVGKSGPPFYRITTLLVPVGQPHQRQIRKAIPTIHSNQTDPHVCFSLFNE